MNHARHLILVKHSLPEIVENVPAHAWELSSEGRTRVGKLAGKLRQYQPEVIVSSAEPKARQTAELICENLGVDVVVMDGLHEHDRSGVPFYSNDKFQSRIQELFEKPDELVFGSETATQALLRFRESIELIMTFYDDKRLAIVSHGTVISLFVSWLTGVDGYSLWKELGLPSFILLDLRNKKLLETVNIN
jgi:broad specificity phosphatase PhoE